MRTISGKLISGLSLLSLSSALLHGQNTSADWWHGDYLTGTWGGHRQKMEDSGVKVSLTYEQDLAGNPVGGLDQGITNSGSIELKVLLDLEKLLGWEDTSLLIRAVDRNGRDLSARYIGNYFPVQQDFGTETFMFQSLALEKLFMDRKLSVKLGRVAMGDDFATSPIYGYYMTNAIDGTPKNLTNTIAFSCYPGSVWGGRIKFENENKSLYGKFGVYQASDRIYDGDKHGFDFDIRHNDGVTLISEIGYAPQLYTRTIRDDDGKTKTYGLPGHYWIGVYTSFWDIPRFDGNGDEDFSYAFYCHADQMVYQEELGSDKGLTVWGLFNYAPKDSVQPMPFQVSGGLCYRGIISGRDHDNTVIGVSYGRFGSDYSEANISTKGNKPTGETVIELAYRIQFTKFMTLQPDIQYIINPAGLSEIDDALALGIRLNLKF